MHLVANPLVLDHTEDGSTSRSARQPLGPSSLPFPPSLKAYPVLIAASCAHSQAWKMVIFLMGPGAPSSRMPSHGFRWMLGTPPASRALSHRAGTPSGGEAGQLQAREIMGRLRRTGVGGLGATHDLCPPFLPDMTGSLHTKSSSAMTVGPGGGVRIAAAGWMR